MSERTTLIAFLATLAAIVTLVIFGALVALQGKNTEALGIGAAVTGLIGVIGTFRPRAPVTSSSGSEDGALHDGDTVQLEKGE